MLFLLLLLVIAIIPIKEGMAPMEQQEKQINNYADMQQDIHPNACKDNECNELTSFAIKKLHGESKVYLNKTELDRVNKLLNYNTDKLTDIKSELLTVSNELIKLSNKISTAKKNKLPVPISLTNELSIYENKKKILKKQKQQFEKLIKSNNEILKVYKNSNLNDIDKDSDRVSNDLGLMAEYGILPEKTTFKPIVKCCDGFPGYKKTTLPMTSIINMTNTEEGPYGYNNYKYGNYMLSNETNNPMIESSSSNTSDNNKKILDVNSIYSLF